MHHLEIDLKLRIFILERVVAMRRGKKGLLYAVFDKSLDIFSCQSLEQILIACFAHTFTTAILLGTQDPKLDPCPVEEIGRGFGNLL